MSKKERKGLKQYMETRGTFTGVFERDGWKRGYKGNDLPTLLLLNIKNDKGNVVSDHLWFNYTKGFSDLGQLEKGDIIQFNARCKEYTKGYFGYKEEVAIEKPIEDDYKLSYPTKIKLIKKFNTAKEE